MDAVPFGPGFAAELRGIDLIDVVSCDAAYCAVRGAFEEHTVLVLRGQNVSDDVRIGFSRAFGPLERTKVGLLSAGSLYIRMTNVGRDGTNDTKSEGKRPAYITGKSEGVEALLKDIFAGASVPTVEITPKEMQRRMEAHCSASPAPGSF